MVSGMSANEMSVSSAVTPAVTQTAPSQAAQRPVAPTKVEVVEKPKITAQEIGEQAASRKAGSINKLDETSQRLQAAIDTLNAAVKKTPTALSFSRDDSSKRFVVQVTDTNTGEIIRNLPGDAVLRMSRQLDSMKGIIFDELF
jgi:flagellar protein FlaG